jgi:SAM-dependent methyltransferase
MKILNLGCGTKVSDDSEVTNIDWSMYLRLRRNSLYRTVASIVLDGERLKRFKSLSGNLMVHNLAKGIPLESNSIDVVYHSHLLEHLDREIVETFLVEVLRVLKPGGVHRIVVPDMEQAVQAYVSHIALCENNPGEAKTHDSYIATIIEQSVRKVAFSSRHQKGFRRLIENVIIGDARKRGETHQWMYDRINLGTLLADAGYKNIVVQSYTTSLVPNWTKYGLDIDRDGQEYKRESMYVEAQKCTDGGSYAPQRDDVGAPSQLRALFER